MTDDVKTRNPAVCEVKSAGFCVRIYQNEKDGMSNPMCSIQRSFKRKDGSVVIDIISFPQHYVSVLSELLRTIEWQYQNYLLDKNK